MDNWNCLLDTLASPDNRNRVNAEAQVEALQNTDFRFFIRSLLGIAKDQDESEVREVTLLVLKASRRQHQQMAMLLLKNAIPMEEGGALKKKKYNDLALLRWAEGGEEEAKERGDLKAEVLATLAANKMLRVIRKAPTKKQETAPTQKATTKRATKAEPKKRAAPAQKAPKRKD
jgi:hypothetical protein